MTALKQGHFLSLINHIQDVARDITACGLILKGFPVKTFPPFPGFTVLNFNLFL